MVPPTIIRRGQVYWLKDCPPLDGDRAKDRPVIVVSSTRMIEADTLVVVVAATTTPRPSSDPDLVKLPNKQEMPNTTSGLPRPCWAVPRWFLYVRRDRLQGPVGYVSRQTLKRIVDAADLRMEEARNRDVGGQ